MSLPVRPTDHERSGRDDVVSVPAEMARTAHELHLDGYSDAEVSRALVDDELTIELLMQRPEGTR
ncbi:MULTISPECIES: hypothetical protein [unclassified Streptomyces]|uniref:hypothetical protein n=1 Tax=unclassified Streptomyces TaxID=2593676 RepID=UPI003801F091